MAVCNIIERHSARSILLHFVTEWYVWNKKLLTLNLQDHLFLDVCDCV